MSRPDVMIDGKVRPMNDAEYAQYLIDSAPHPTPVPSSITSRQLFIAMSMQGMITANEALAAAQTGAIPAAIGTVIATLTIDQQLSAKITFARMRDVLRNDQLIALVGAALSKTDAQIDDLFRLGMTL